MNNHSHTALLDTLEKWADTPSQPTPNAVLQENKICHATAMRVLRIIDTRKTEPTPLPSTILLPL